MHSCFVLRQGARTMTEQPRDVHELLSLLKAATEDRPPYKGEYTAEEKALMDELRTHGAAAIEPMIAFLADLMAETEETIEREEEDAIYYYADKHVTDLLGDLPLSEEQVRRLFVLDAQYSDNDWYSDQLTESLGRQGEAVIGPALDILRDGDWGQFGRVTAASVLEEVAKAHPDLRERIADELVAIMSAQNLAEETDDDRELNAFMLGTLGETQQDRYLPFVEQMYITGRVDAFIIDLDWVRDTLQGIDPMARHPDTNPEELERLARLLGLVAGDDEEDDYVPPPRGASFIPVNPGVFTPFHAEKRPKRNDPCWCGSGKKYKHCHWRDDQQKRV